MNVKSILIIALASSISACSWFSSIDPIDVTTEAIKKVELDLKSPEPLKLKAVNWLVVTQANSNETFKALSDKNIDPVLISLTDREYKDLALNMSNIRKLIVHQQKIIQSYKKYYESDLTNK